MMSKKVEKQPFRRADGKIRQYGFGYVRPRTLIVAVVAVVILYILVFVFHI
jgi:hypothetical protein